MRRVVVCLAVLGLSACGSRPKWPLRLLETATESGRLPRAAKVTAGDETRPALIESASFRVELPRRALLTFGAGVSFIGTGEPHGWFNVTVKANGREIENRRLNPRAMHGWRNRALPLEGLGRQARLSFEIGRVDRDGRPMPAAPELTLAVAEPTIHDLETYGQHKGIVLVSIDTLRRDHVGAYGYPRPTTPTLDALAKDAIFCEDAVSTSSWTLPAHLSLLTSADPACHGGTDTNHGFARRVPTLPALLRDAGFATHAVTSHLYVSRLYGLDEGFDTLDFQQDRRAANVVDHAIDIVDRAGDRPFFLFLHFYDPHWHYAPPEAQLRLFEREYHGRLTGKWGDLKNRTRADTTPEDLAHILALYDGEIRYTDDELGRFLGHLRDRGLDRSTLVVVTSDHGEEFLDHGSWEHQKTLYEEVIRVPLLVRGPGVAARRERAPVSLLDIAPTILAWASVDRPASFQGQSLLAPAGPREQYGETDHTVDRSHKLFLRTGQDQWKTILTLAPDGKGMAQEEWFDLPSDRGEQRGAIPTAGRGEEIRQRARARWGACRGEGPVGNLVCLNAEQRERFRALGYLGGGSPATCPAGGAAVKP